MRKLPYIPLYIGDWEQDTNTISLEAEGALIKLVFKLWKSNEKGKLVISFNQLSILLKKPQEIALKIVRELQENNVLNIEIYQEGIVNIESRRMLKDALKSKAFSENGKKGGRSKKAKGKPIESRSKAEVKPNADNDIDIEDDFENKKGGAGDFSDKLIFPFRSEAFFLAWQAWFNYRKDIKKPYPTFSSAQAELQGLSKMTEEKAIGLLTKALKNSWKNIIYDDEQSTTSNGRQAAHDKKSSLRDLAYELRKSDIGDNGGFGQTGS